jgi:hypothetical protein
MGGRTWAADAVERVWFNDSWTPWARVVVPLTLLLTMPAVILTCFEQPLVLVMAGSLAGASGLRTGWCE